MDSGRYSLADDRLWRTGFTAAGTVTDLHRIPYYELRITPPLHLNETNVLKIFDLAHDIR
jgi:hypothetical protein